MYASHRRTGRIVSAIALVLFTAGLSARAQDSTRQSSLSGTVLDANGATVNGVTVSATAPNHDVPYTATTNQQGEFTIALPPGLYLVKATAAGFNAFEDTVDARQPNFRPIRIVLQVAGSTSTVTITASDYLTASVGSATKTLTPLRDIPQSITVVTDKQIRDQSMVSIAEVVNYVPGSPRTRVKTIVINWSFVATAPVPIFS